MWPVRTGVPSTGRRKSKTSPRAGSSTMRDRSGRPSASSCITSRRLADSMAAQARRFSSSPRSGSVRLSRQARHSPPSDAASRGGTSQLQPMVGWLAQRCSSWPSAPAMGSACRLSVSGTKPSSAPQRRQRVLPKKTGAPQRQRQLRAAGGLCKAPCRRSTRRSSGPMAIRFGSRRRRHEAHGREGPVVRLSGGRFTMTALVLAPALQPAQFNGNQEGPAATRPVLT